MMIQSDFNKLHDLREELLHLILNGDTKNISEALDNYTSKVITISFKNAILTGWSLCFKTFVNSDFAPKADSDKELNDLLEALRLPKVKDND